MVSYTRPFKSGVTEIELIIPNRIPSYYGIGDLFQTFANNAVENGQVPMNEPIVIAHSQQGSIHTVAVPWEKGLSYIGHKTSIDQLSSIEDEEVKLQPIDAQNTFLGGMDDRDEYHQSPSVLLFKFDTSEECIESFFKEHEEATGLMFYKTNSETARMAYNAKILSGISATFFKLNNQMRSFVFSLSLAFPMKRVKASICGLKCNILQKTLFKEYSLMNHIL